MSRRRGGKPRWLQPEFAVVVIGGLVLAVLVGLAALLCGGIGTEVTP